MRENSFIKYKQSLVFASHLHLKKSCAISTDLAEFELTLVIILYLLFSFS